MSKVTQLASNRGRIKDWLSVGSMRNATLNTTKDVEGSSEHRFQFTH
jgi:hypothetical protein